MKKGKRNEHGFTLIELLIVVIILGVLAAVAIPQFGSSTDDAKLSTLNSNLSSLRNAIELYYHQHNSTYPGAVLETDGTTATTALNCPQAFEKQFTLYSNASGVTSATKDTTLYPYGPYIKKGVLPENRFNDLNTVVCDTTTIDITAAASGGTAGWKFYTQTGRLIADDGAHDAN